MGEYEQECVRLVELLAADGRLLEVIPNHALREYASGYVLKAQSIVARRHDQVRSLHELVAEIEDLVLSADGGLSLTVTGAARLEARVKQLRAQLPTH